MSHYLDDTPIPRASQILQLVSYMSEYGKSDHIVSEIREATKSWTYKLQGRFICEHLSKRPDHVAIFLEHCHPAFLVGTGPNSDQAKEFPRRSSNDIRRETTANSRSRVGIIPTSNPERVICAKPNVSATPSSHGSTHTWVQDSSWSQSNSPSTGGGHSNCDSGSTTTDSGSSSGGGCD